MTLLTMTPWAEASMRRLTKPGPATSAEAMPSASASAVGQPAGQLTRVGADLLAQLQRQVGGVVAVLGIARALDGDGRRQRGRVEAMLGQHRGGGGLEQLGQVGGGHEGPSYGLGWSAPRIRFHAADRCVRLSHAHWRSLVIVRPRSSGDRASASGAEGRRFESCRGHHCVFAVQRRFLRARASDCLIGA